MKDLYRTAFGVTWHERGVRRGVDWDGSLQVLHERPAPWKARTPRHPAALHLGGRPVHRSNGLTVETQHGWSPPWGRGQPTVEEGEYLRTAWIHHDGRREDTWLACDAKLVGIPRRHLPGG